MLQASKQASKQAQHVPNRWAKKKREPDDDGDEGYLY